MMKHVRKAVILLLLFAVGTGFAFADGTPEEEYPTTEDGKILVTFWTHGRHDLEFMMDQV